MTANKKRYVTKKRRRENAQHRGYDGDWQKLQARFLARFPLCIRCGQAATLVDHIKPVRTHPALRLVISNLQSLCFGCHSIKTKRKDFGMSSGIMPDTNIDGFPLDPEHPWNKDSKQ